jgi:TPR repeat protein
MGCLLHAYALQQAESKEADAAFLRTCKLGLAIGCTNYAAGLLVFAHEPVCARRLFERACEVREPFGCGMLGRMLAFDAKTPELKAKARTYFDRTCSDLGAAICRMYAFHLEQGDLGPVEPATVKALMLRACETGDSEACGHDSAGETFK